MSKFYFKKLKMDKIVLSMAVLSPFALSLQAENSKTIEELFMNSLVADAIYVDFPEDTTKFGVTLDTHESWENEKDRIKVITENFELLDFEPNTSSGFAGGMFKYLTGDNVGKTIFAVRGTSDLVDIVEADIYGIAAMGVPQFQVRDLYNYIQRIKAPEGAGYRYLNDSIFEEYWLDFGWKTNGEGYTDWFHHKVDGVGHSLGGGLTAVFS